MYPSLPSPTRNRLIVSLGLALLIASGAFVQQKGSVTSVLTAYRVERSADGKTILSSDVIFRCDILMQRVLIGSR